MAFAAAVRRGSSSFLHSQCASFRLYTTLTSPKLFVSGLSRNTDDQRLADAFSQFGRLYEAKVMTDRMSGRSKGFAFVTYESVDDAEKARQAMHGQYLDGWVIFVDPAKPKETRPPPQVQPASDASGLGFRSNKTVGWCGNN